MNFNENLLKEIEQKYSVKSNFSKLFLQTFFDGKDISNISSVSEIISMPEPTPMYFDFALSTNLRGRDAVKLLLPYLTQENGILQKAFKKSKRYLDVGCAYGGFLVAFAEQGLDPLGIEIDETLAKYGAINCQEHGLSDKVITGDFLSYDVEKLGKFDIITCNDVIEHVQDPEKAIERLASLLNKGGVLYLEIPNKDCIKFVEKDGHFCIFGITLLQRNIAKDLYKLVTNNIYYEGMGEYFELGYYLEHLSKYGLKVNVSTERHLIGNMNDVPSLLKDLALQFNEFYYNFDKDIDYFLRNTLVNRYFEYLAQISRDYRHARINGGSDYFIKKYLLSFWSITAIKE
jgi:SAM-dependent methyltransferase